MKKLTRTQQEALQAKEQPAPIANIKSKAGRELCGYVLAVLDTMPETADILTALLNDGRKREALQLVYILGKMIGAQ